MLVVRLRGGGECVPPYPHSYESCAPDLFLYCAGKDGLRRGWGVIGILILAAATTASPTRSRSRSPLRA